MKKKSVALASAAAIFVGGCGNSGTNDGPPILHGSDATLIAQVDCGDDGVANVHVVYGEIDKTTLIGRNDTTLTVGGAPYFDERYGISDGYKNLDFTITTSPTRGTCTTTLTDDESGDVIAERQSAGKVKLEAILDGR